MPQPAVSVVMPAYNAQKYLRPTLDSLLAQTLTNAEFICVNDGSTDDTPNILSEYAERDPRVRFINEGKMGFVGALNRGCALAQAPFIARMDADDICLPNRLARQLEFLQQNPHIALCGTLVETFSDTLTSLFHAPTAPADIKCALLFYSPIMHPTVMFRAEMFLTHGLAYDPSVKEAADYDLWLRYAQKFPIANINEVLLRYRIHPGQVTQADAPRQRAFGLEIRRRALLAFGLAPTDDQLAIHQNLGNWHYRLDNLEQLANVEAWLLTLHQHNNKTNYFDGPAFNNLLGQHWYAACTNNTHLGSAAYARFRASPLAPFAELTPRHHARFFVKSLLKK